MCKCLCFSEDVSEKEDSTDNDTLNSEGGLTEEWVPEDFYDFEDTEEDVSSSDENPVYTTDSENSELPDI